MSGVGQTFNTDTSGDIGTSALATTTAPTYTTNTQEPLSLNLAGGLRVDGSVSTPTYSAGVQTLVIANAATDIFTISGSSTKTISITNIEISGLSNNEDGFGIAILKRSSANSGGTSTTRVAVPHDSLSPAATAVVQAYTANPTIGTLVGIVRSSELFFPTTANLGQNLTYEFGTRPSQPIILRGTSELLTVNFHGNSLGGSSLNISVEWTEG
jgi:hypothetical protein